jgi:hypothetical protein
MRRSSRAFFSEPRLEVGVPPQGFEPGMSVRSDAVVFEQLALERLCLREVRRERRIAPAVGNSGPQQADASTPIVREHREDFPLSLQLSTLDRQSA